MPYPEKDQFGHKKKHLRKQKFSVVISMIHLFTGQLMRVRNFFMPCKTHQEYDDKSWSNTIRTTIRTFDVPDYVQSNAQRGLDNLDRAGDGLVERTISEARALAKDQ